MKFTLSVGILALWLASIGCGDVNRGDALEYQARGDDQYRFGNLETDIYDYTQAIKIEPTFPGFYTARGYAESASGGYDSALADFNTALKLTSNKWVPAFSGRALVEIQFGNYDAAIKDLTQAVLSTRNITAVIRPGARSRNLKATSLGPSPTTTKLAGWILTAPIPRSFFGLLELDRDKRLPQTKNSPHTWIVTSKDRLITWRLKSAPSL